MAVISNKNTAQTPIATGRSGSQVVKFIDAPRVYIKSADSTATPVTVKSNGATPSGGWVDLGIVNGKVRVQYEKTLREIRTGLDNVLRQTYIESRTASYEFLLSQFDDVVLEQLSGITPSMITSGSIYQFAIGGEDVITKALLMVVQNKLDGKEWQFYHPAADLTFNIEDAGDETAVRGRANLKAFTYGSSEAMVIKTVFA